MTRYKITIEIENKEPPSNESYRSAFRKIYEQEIEDLDMSKVVPYLNSLSAKTPPPPPPIQMPVAEAMPAHYTEK